MNTENWLLPQPANVAPGSGPGLGYLKPHGNTAGENGLPGTDTEATPPPAGEPGAERLNSLFAGVYQELRGMARGMLRTGPLDRTLRPTVLVHEAYLRLRHTYCSDGVNRSHFFGAAAEAMRRILVEDARRRTTLRRGGHWERIPLDQIQVATDAHPEMLLDIDEALDRLAVEYPLEARLVRLMFFGGLTVAETGQALELCDRTVKRHWAFARAWLYHELGEAREAGGIESSSMRLVTGASP